MNKQVTKIINKCGNNDKQAIIDTIVDGNYKIVVKAKDIFLSGWGNSGSGGHHQLVFCKDSQTACKCVDSMRKDGAGFKYVNWFYLSSGMPVKANASYTAHIIDNCPLWNGTKCD